MRKETFGIGTYVHVVHRGARAAHIVRDDHDRQRFLKLLKYLNDENVPRNWEREVTISQIKNGYERPENWPERKPYISLMAYCLLDNHFHLLIREEIDGGLSRFMQRLCTSMAAHFNLRHEERGSLFQGPFKAEVISDDRHLQYVSAYIQVKNGFERQRARKQSYVPSFNALFDSATRDPYVSLGEYMQLRNGGLIDLACCSDVLMDKRRFRLYAADVIEGRQNMETID